MRIWWGICLSMVGIGILGCVSVSAARQYQVEERVDEPFVLQDFDAELSDVTTQDGEFVVCSWQAWTGAARAGALPAKVRVRIEGFSDGDVVAEDISSVRWHMGMEPLSTRGQFQVPTEDWFRARSFVIAVERVRPPAHASGLAIRRINVFEGSPMAMGGFVPLSWSTVVTTEGCQVSEVRLYLRIWGEGDKLVTSYPLSRITLAPHSRIKVAHMTVVTREEFEQAESISIDVVAKEARQDDPASSAPELSLRRSGPLMESEGRGEIR